MVRRVISIAKWVGVVVLVLAISLFVGGGIYQSVSSAQELAANPPPGQLVQVDGRPMHIHCIGTGSPTVVFEAGLASSGAGMGPVHRAVSSTTRSCAYDRSGLGYSAPADHPVRNNETAALLKKLLDGAGVSDTIVLVGASRGGTFARAFYAQFPDRVAGLVFVDSSHENQRIAFGDPTGDTPPFALAISRWLQPLGVIRASGLVQNKTAQKHHLSDEDRAQLNATFGQSHTAQAMYHESLAFIADMDVSGQPPSLGDVPVIVLTKADVQDQDDMDALELQEEMAELAVWHGLQKDIASKSTRGRWVPVTDTSHHIATDQPEVVVSSIIEVVQIARADAMPIEPAAVSDAAPVVVGE